MVERVRTRVRTKQVEAAFSYYAAHRWNQLPDDFKSTPTQATFKSKLKTVLLCCVFIDCFLYCTFICFAVFGATYNLLLHCKGTITVFRVYHFGLFVFCVFLMCVILMLNFAYYEMLLFEICYINKAALP